MPITINIPDDYTTIQAGLNAADSTDTVLVQPGTYYENIFWPETNGIKLISAGDSSNTIIDGGGISSVLYINPNTALIDVTTLISGFTIRNGGGVTSGGGIFVSGASPTIENLIIENNHANQLGGAINMQYEANLIVRSSIIRNNSSGDQGGAFRVYQSSPHLIDLEITNNSARDGGGLYLVECVDPVLEDLLIFNNEATQGGGGVYFMSNSNISFINSTVLHNSAIWGGGGIYLYAQGGTLGENLSLIENHSDYMGGAIHLRFGSPVFSNITISGNTCLDGNEGIYVQNGSLTIQGSNIFDNGTGLNNVDNTNFATAINNWWGDDTGPYHATQNGSGQGDSCNVFVNVLPFLESQDTEAPPIPAQNTIVTSTGNDFISLNWDPSFLGDFAGFKLYYDTDESGYPYSNSVDVGSATSHSLSGLSPGTQYFLAVTVYDTNGNESWYSTGVTGTTRVMEVQNLDIAGDEELQHLVTHDPTITFDYFDSMGEPQTNYQIQISSHSDFSIVDVWESGEAASDLQMIPYAGEPLNNGQTYYLRVRVGSGAFWSNWASLEFRMNSIPSDPVPLSLINDAVATVDVTVEVNNSIDAESDALTYNFRLYADGEQIIQLDSAIAVMGGVEATSWTVTTELQDNGRFWWTVQSFDGYEYSSLIGPESFLVNNENDTPANFSLLYPGAAEEIITLSPILRWQPAYDPDPIDTVNYVLYLDTPGPGVEIFDIGVDTSYQVVSPLLDNTTYSWKVVASDLSAANKENVGGYQNFRVNTANDLPTAFDLLAPENGSMVVDLTPTLLWAPSSDPDDVMQRNNDHKETKTDLSTNEIMVITGYQVYLDTDSLFTETVPIEVINPSYTPNANLTENMVYYWKVEAVDDDGGVLFSDRWSFWTNAANEAPGEIVLLTPVSNAEVSTNPTLSWTESQDPDLFDELNYTLRYGTDVFSLIDVNTESSTMFTPDDPLDDNTEYIWQVVVSDLYGASFTTAYFSFYVNSENDAPAGFELVSPDSNAWITDSDLMLVWEPSTDLEGSEISYIVSMSSDSEIILPIDTVSSNYYNLYGLAEGYYYWNIEAVDNLEGRSVSPTWSFLINAINDAPDPFAIHAPINGAILTGQLVSFSWEPSSSGDPGDQTSYLLTLGTSPENLSSIYQGVDTLFNYPEILSDNTSYYWQVTAIDLAGATTPNVGGYQSFTVNTENDLPVAFNLLTPVSDMMVTTLTPEFLWEASADPDDATIALHETGKGKFNEDRSTENNSVMVITGYDFYLSTDAGLADVTPVEVIGTNYVPTEDLLENQVYYWAVCALDDSGGVTFSDTASFWTNSQNDLPAAFSMLDPVGLPLLGLSTLIPTFTWTSYNMRRGTRKVGSVTYRDPGGTGNYNSKSDVVETLTAKSSSSAIPARLGYLFNSLGIENNIVSQKALIESLIQTLEVYEQPHRGELLNSYLDVSSLGIKDFTSTLRLMKDNIKAIQYDDPVSMTKGWLNWLVEDNGSPDFILFTTDFIPLFDPDSQNAVLKVVLGAFFNDFDENLARLTYASNEYKKIQKNIDSSSATEPLRYTYLMFLEKEKARQERIEADRHEFEIASQLAEEERVESQVEKNSFKFTSLMVIGGAISVIALFGLILLLFAILRTLKHIQSSLNQNESISTQPEDAETILNA